MENLKEAFQATRKFFVTRVDFDQFSVDTHTIHHDTFKTHAEAQDRSDLLNFIAVMNLIKDPPADIPLAASSIYPYYAPDSEFTRGYEVMIDMMISEAIRSTTSK